MENDRPTLQSTPNPTTGPGSNSNLQPSASFVQEVQAQTDLQQANTAPAVPEVVKAYISDDFSPTIDNQQQSKPTWRKFVVPIALIGILLVGVAGAVWYRTSDPQQTASVSGQNTRSGSRPQETAPKAHAPTAFEANLKAYPKYLEGVQNFSLPIYVPKDGQIALPAIGSNTDSGQKKELFEFSINPQNGMGLVPGSYFVVQRSLDGTYNPPANCGLPEGIATSSPVPCTKYSGSTSDMPAYVHVGRQTGTITNTSIPDSSYITLYAVRGKTLVIIETSSATPEALYKMAESWTPIKPIDLPADTTVNF